MVSALDALLAEEKKTGITTNSKMLDDLFGNGIPLGAVTELCGMAGLGKVLWFKDRVATNPNPNPLSDSKLHAIMFICPDSAGLWWIGRIVYLFRCVYFYFYS